AMILAQRLVPRLDLARPGERDRLARTGVARGFARRVLAEPLLEVDGGAGVERSVAATEDVHVRHARMVSAHRPERRLSPEPRERHWLTIDANAPPSSICPLRRVAAGPRRLRQHA